MDDCKIEKIDRLGKKMTGKERPMLVRVRSEEERWKILRRNTGLRKIEKYKRVFIGKDMNREDREEDKRMREFLKKVRAEEPSYEWRIRNGRIERGGLVRRSYNLGDYMRGERGQTGGGERNNPEEERRERIEGREEEDK